MRAAAHLRVVSLAVEVMPRPFAALLGRLREGIECGATLPDEFRSYWDVDGGPGRNRVLMHRCYVDSEERRDHGCPVQVRRYVEGAPRFFEDWAEGKLNGCYDVESFALNAGAFLGVLSHHVCDLWTPVHVGCSIPPSALGYKTRAGLHSRVEADLDRAARRVDTILPYAPSKLDLTVGALETVAQAVFDRYYLRLSGIYPAAGSPDVRAQFLEPCIRGAAQSTADAWLTVLRAVRATALALASAGLSPCQGPPVS